MNDIPYFGVYFVFISAGSFRLMSEEHVSSIQSNYNLLTNMKLDETLKHLQSDLVIRQTDIDNIKSKSTPQDQRMCLLDVICRKPDHYFGFFVKALCESNQSDLVSHLFYSGKHLFW